MSLVTRMGLLIVGLIITYASVVFIVQLLSPLDSDQTLSRSMALEISSAIDGMFNAPPGMTKNYSLPARNCAVFFSTSSVNVTAGNYSYESPLLMPEYDFRIDAPESVACNTGERRIISFYRIGKGQENPDTIMVRLQERQSEPEVTG